VRRPQRGREGRGVEIGKRILGLVDASDQKKAPDFEIPRVSGVHPIAMQLERRTCRVQRLRRPLEVTRGEPNLRFRENTPSAGDRLFRFEGGGRTPQVIFRANVIAVLRHRDAAQRERRRVFAQVDAVQRAEGIARGKRARRSRDQRVHLKPRHTCHSHPPMP
jgi:hypothetical protein